METIIVGTRKSPTFIKATAPRPRTQAEINERIRSRSYADALTAVAWLNDAKGTAAYKRVLMVRRELDELAKMLDALGQQWRAHKATRRRTEGKINEREQETAQLEIFRRRHNDLNRMLTRYTFVPALDYAIPSAAWRFDTVPKLLGGPETEIEDRLFTVLISEASVVAALARLATQRELYKVRLCDQCGERWRVSAREMDRFCSDRCRDAFRASAPGFKERAAERQRLYRQRMKENS
jgi:hypothetical protein